MRKLFVLLIVVLTVFTLASCKNEPAPEHVHSWSDVETTKQPTCTTDGVRTYKCSCGETKTESIPKLGHSHNEYGLCLTCGDYKGLTMTRVQDNIFVLENASFKEGKNYIRFTLEQDIDYVNEFRCYTNKSTNTFDNTKIRKLFIYDSVFIQTCIPVGNYINTEDIEGTDGLRTVYLVVDCSEDCSFESVEFFS